ncbi:MAG TPA: site-specific integrase, partial [Pseudoduganella sp.]
MSLTSELSSSTALAVTLPSRVFTRSGASIDPRDDVWAWTDGPFNAHIDFRCYVNGFEAFVPNLKLCLIPFVRGYSCHYAGNLESAFRHFTRRIGNCPETAFTTAHVSS